MFINNVTSFRRGLMNKATLNAFKTFFAKEVQRELESENSLRFLLLFKFVSELLMVMTCVFTFIIFVGSLCRIATMITNSHRTNKGSDSVFVRLQLRLWLDLWVIKYRTSLTTPLATVVATVEYSLTLIGIEVKQDGCTKMRDKLRPYPNRQLQRHLELLPRVLLRAFRILMHDPEV